MTAVFTYKVYFALGVVISVGLTSLADNEVQNRSKYKYGYVISHKGGSSQAHLESRDGNLALGTYYVNLHNGTGQKVTYFADDLGFHTGVSYSSQNGKGSSKTQIAMGLKALAAFGDSEVEQNTASTVSSPTLLFGKKIQKSLDVVTPKPTAAPKLNYTPVPGGFYLTHESLGTFNDTTENPNYAVGLTSQTFSNAGTHSEGLPQNVANTQSFYSTPENAKSQINQLHVQFTTPSIKSYTAAPQQAAVFSGDRTSQFSQSDQNVKVSTYATNFNDLSYSKEKSIEKTNFADIDSQIISEVQKHAEQIIMKDLQKSQNVNLDNEFTRFSSGFFQPSTATMQPIVVTSDGETGVTNIISTTAIPIVEISKSSKNLQSGTINSVKITEKNSDQALQDSGYFRVSLSPSFASSINVSQTPHQSINAGSADPNSVSNSTLCQINSCAKNQEIFSIDLITDKPRTQSQDSVGSDSGNNLGTAKPPEIFYPQNKLHEERHYITTIDVQKAISLDFNQNEAGNIQLAQNFPFNKIKPAQQIQTQYNPTPQPIVSNQISQDLYAPETNINTITTPQKPYILNTVTAAPGLFDVTPNQNLPVLQGINDISSGQIQYAPVVQDRVGSTRLGYENQLVVPPPPVRLTNDAVEEFRQRQENLQHVQKSIQELRQQILSNIDEQHEEEQRKQGLVDEERKQYFENLKKVEEVKNSYGAVNSQANLIQATASPVSSVESVSNVEIVPQTHFVSSQEAEYGSAPQTQFQSEAQVQYGQPQQVQQFEAPPPAQYQPPIQTQQFNAAPPTQFQTVTQSQQIGPVPQVQYQAPTSQPQYEPASQPQYEPAPQPQYVQPPQTVQTQFEPASQSEYVPPPPQTFQTEIKDFRHEVAVPQTPIQSVPNVEVYQKQVLPYSQNNAARQYTLYDNQNVFPLDNNIQQSEKVQVGNYVPQVASVAFQQRLSVPQPVQLEEKPKNVQFTVLNSQINAVPASIASEILPPAKVADSKPLVVNRVLPIDYGRLLHVKQPVSLFPTYQLPLTDTKLGYSEIYPQQVVLPIQIPQAYKLLAYPELIPVSGNKQYHSTLIQKATNKVRVQPLKPSSPDEDSQREQVQNLLAQPQYNPTFYYAGLPVNNRLQLRHVRKNQISNSDQVRSQSVIRRGKSLKNLRIEYGFKPPLRPSVEFTEEVKPSIYGPSVPPQ